MTHSSQAPAPTAEAKGPGTGNAGWLARYTDAVMNTFGTPSRVLVRGSGAHVWDADGQEYIDLLAGIAVNCLGHAHPAIVEAVSTQISTLGHVSNFFTTPAQVGLAEELVRLTFPDHPAHDSRVFLANSGTEANEAAFKIARRHGGSRRPRVLALQDAFHGRTMGALALTHKAAYREPFEPLPGGVEFIPAGDVEALRTALGPDVAALVVEPIQGEAGVRELPAGYLEAARELTEAAGALLIIDEVQTGMGRTGAWMAHHLLAPGIVPDVVTLAKGLGGGVPIGAVVASGQAAALLEPGQHGTTFGGNPVACAAALAVIGTIRSRSLLERVQQLGSAWSRELAVVDGVNQVRGRGLLLGVGLDDGLPPAAEIAAALAARGFIVNAPRPDTIRLAPPFILSDDDARAFTTTLSEVLDRAARPGGNGPPGTRDQDRPARQHRPDPVAGTYQLPGPAAQGPGTARHQYYPGHAFTGSGGAAGHEDPRPGRRAHLLHARGRRPRPGPYRCPFRAGGDRGLFACPHHPPSVPVVRRATRYCRVGRPPGGPANARRRRPAARRGR